MSGRFMEFFVLADAKTRGETIERTQKTKMRKITIVLILTSLVFSSCDLNIRKGYGPGSNSSIEESKQLKVFLKEYQSVTCQFGDSVRFTIKEAFAETIFYRDDTIRRDEECQIILIIDCNRFVRTYIDEPKFYWYLEPFNSVYSGDYTNKDSFNVSMVTRKVNSIEAPDSLKVYVVTAQEKNINERFVSDTVGSFYLVAK